MGDSNQTGQIYYYQYENVQSVCSDLLSWFKLQTDDFKFSDSACPPGGAGKVLFTNRKMLKFDLASKETNFFL